MDLTQVDGDNNVNHQVFGQSYQATNLPNADLTTGGFAPSSESNDFVNEFVDLTQFDSVNNSMPDSAATQNQDFYGTQQTQPDLSQNTYSDFLGSLDIDNMDYDALLDPALQTESSMVATNSLQSQNTIQIRQLMQFQLAAPNQQPVQNQLAIPNQQSSQNQLAIPSQQPSQNQLAIPSQQPVQSQQTVAQPAENPDHQQSVGSEVTHQVVVDDDDNDLFGDKEYAMMLGPVADFNAQN